MTMTIDTAPPPAAPTIHQYPLDNLWQKGCYVARIDGPDPKYGVARSFIRGKGIKSRGMLEYTAGLFDPLPAWVVRAGAAVCGGCGRPDTAAVELLAVTAVGWAVVSRGVTSRDLLAIHGSGPPGDDPVSQVAEALDDRVEVYAADLEAPF